MKIAYIKLEATFLLVAALFTICKRWATQISINGWMDKQNVVHPYSEVFFNVL